MAVLNANTSVDMTDWNFDNINGGTITRHTSFQYFLTGLDGTTHYEFTGVGLTYNGSNQLTGGTVTGYRVLDNSGNTLLTVSGFTFSGTALANAIATNDASGGFENTIFGQGNNTINGSDSDDVLTGSVNTDTIHAGGGNDLITETHSGTNQVFGDDGDDTLYLNAEPYGTQFDGGAGQDTLIIDRSTNYIMQVGSSGGYMGIENIVLTGNASRMTITLDDDAAAAGETLHVDASQLGAASKFIFSGTDSDSTYDVVAGAGNDALVGGDFVNVFHLEKGGNDRATGGAGDNSFYMGGALTAQDRLIGADTGTSTVFLDGNYTSPLALGARTLVDIGTIFVQSGHNYNLVTHDRNVAAGGSLTVAAIYLNTGDKLTFDGSAETNGSFSLYDGAGNDVLTGGARGDDIFLTGGGHNVVNSGGGDDTCTYINSFNLAEVLDGGAGEDSLTILQDLTGTTFTSATIANFESLALGGFYDNSIAFDDSVVGAGKTFTVDMATSNGQVSTFDGSAELNGKFVLDGGGGEDTLIGGAKADRLTGGGNADVLKGGLANDTYAYLASTDSSGIAFDTVDGFDFNGDLFEVQVAVTGIDPTVNGGALNDLTFDADLAAAADAVHLLAGHAVVFKPGSGDHAGETFLVINQDGVAGYSVDTDIVIQLVNAAHLGGVDTSDFVLPVV